MFDKDLIGKILEASNHINKVSRRGSGNYIIASKQASDILSDFFDRPKFRKEKIKRIFA